MNQPPNPYAAPYAPAPDAGQIVPYGAGQPNLPYGYAQYGYGQVAPGGIPDGVELAPWWLRAAAVLVDVAAVFVLYLILVLVFAGAAHLSQGLAVLVLFVNVVALAVYGLRQFYLVGEVGQSLGKRMVGVKIVGLVNGMPIGGGNGDHPRAGARPGRADVPGLPRTDVQRQAPDLRGHGDGHGGDPRPSGLSPPPARASGEGPSSAWTRGLRCCCCQDDGGYWPPCSPAGG